MTLDMLTGFTSQRHDRALMGIGGKKFENGLSLEQVRTELFSWKALEMQVQVPFITPDGVEMLFAEDQKALVRSDTKQILKVVGAGHAVHQYDEWLGEYVATLVDDDEVAVQAAGLVNGGRQAFVQIASPETQHGPGGVDFRPFILAASSHDQSVASIYKRNTIVIWCENTYRASLQRNEEQSIRIKHTRNSTFQAAHVREALQILFETGDSFSREVEELLNISVSDNQFREIVTQYVAPTTDSKRSTSIAQRKAGELFQLWRHDERAAQWNGTGFGAMQALSTWQQHFATVKGAVRTERNAARLIDGRGDREDLRIRELIATVAG